jgi:hypothetical protein
MLGGVPGQREIFEEICRKVVKVEHPGAWSPREHRGDHGIDILVGDAETGLDVYQVKFFREGVGDSQQAQIRASYDRILETEGKIRSWTLMLPLELSFEEMRWFEGWRSKKDHDIALISGLQLEEKLKRPEYDEALHVLAKAFSIAGLEIKWFERPVPVLKVVFCIADPYRSEAHKVVSVRVLIENVGRKSVKNPKLGIRYSEPGIVALAENPVWKRVPGAFGLTGMNPRILEKDGIIRPGEDVEVLPIQYPLSRFREIGIQCKLLMDDEAPAQSGVRISAKEIPLDGLKEKFGEENFFPVLHPCGANLDPYDYLTPEAKEILSGIINSEASNEGKGITLIRGFPSNNEMIACVFSLQGGQTVGCKRDELTHALEELIRTGFMLELDQDFNRTRYKLC